MKIISWNINGIRAILKKEKIKEIEKEKPDILCFQETKIDQEALEKINIDKESTLIKEWSFSNIKKGYSGVSNWSKLSPLKTSEMDIKEFDQEGRFLLQEYQDFYLINAYFPNGQSSHKRVPYKLDFSYKLLELAKKLNKKKGVIICGDVNTAHTDIDLSNPKKNKKTTGFLPEEKNFIDDIIRSGFVDAFRYFHPIKKEQYSWWSYRTAARQRNIGWRIDYFFVSSDIKDKLKSCYYLDKFLGSDHCPIVLEIDLK